MNNFYISDGMLIERYLKGNEACLEKLVLRYKDDLFTYIFGLTNRNRDLAEDLFQDTFIKIITIIKKGDYNDEGKFKGWAKCIAHNLVIDYFRKVNKMPAFRSKNKEFSIFDVLFSSEKNVEELIITEQIRADIRKLIEYLPKKQKQVIIMHYFNRMKFQEIAEELDVSINTVLGRMRYAMENLRIIVKRKKIFAST